jgi:hypothetical protein
MAKGKHAAALFEVIHSDRRFGRKTPPARALATPKWWFKGKPAPAPTPAEVPVSSTSASLPTDGPVPLAPEPINYMPSIPAERPVDVKLDADRQQISFKLTYTSAVVGGFALLVVLSLAYIIGRKVNAGPSSAIAATVSSSDIRKKPAQASVLEIAKARSNREETTPIAPDADESANIIDPGATSRPPAPPPLVNTAPPQPFNGKRLINQNYVIIQGFPAEEKALAEEALAKLAEARIGATIERGIGGYPATWHIVVGTIPFERTKNNPVYDAYIKSIMDVSAKYAGKSQFKKFAPYAKKWAGDA